MLCFSSSVEMQNSLSFGNTQEIEVEIIKIEKGSAVSVYTKLIVAEVSNWRY